MSLLTPRDRQMLEERFSQDLMEKVTLALFTQRDLGLTIPGRTACPTCRQTQDLLQEVVDLSPLLDLEVRDIHSEPEGASSLGIQRVPAIVLGGDGTPNLRYYGIPLGHEFMVLLYGLVALSRKENPLKPETLEKVREIDTPVHIQVFVTPT